MADLTLLLAPRGPVEAIQWPGDWTDRHAPPALDVLRRWVADRYLDDEIQDDPRRHLGVSVLYESGGEQKSPVLHFRCRQDAGPDDCADDDRGDVTLQPGDWVLREPGGVLRVATNAEVERGWRVLEDRGLTVLPST